MSSIEGRRVSVLTPAGYKFGEVDDSDITPASPYPLLTVELDSGARYRDFADEIL